mgnify:CR=1 FL=1
MPQTRCPENVYFNPRSREGSDEDVTTKVDSLEISIHAPARGATSTYQHTHYSTRISIHAPARGATDFSDFFKFFLRISIHAPARGATTLNFPPSESSAYFNPRSREGSDNICSKTGLVIQDFNPRSREGSDWVRAFLCALFEIFQSTLPRGERRSQLIGFMISKYFNPRSREGSDV